MHSTESGPAPLAAPVSTAPVSTAAIGVGDLDGLGGPEAAALLRSCLDVTSWVEAVAAGRPYGDRDRLLTAADRASVALTWTEAAGALDRHPRIGAARAAAATSGTERSWSAQEQAGVAAAEREALAQGNTQYEARFGHLFLICATGLTGAQILVRLRERLTHTPEQERPVVVTELRRIAAVRLAKAVDR